MARQNTGSSGSSFGRFGSGSTGVVSSLFRRASTRNMPPPPSPHNTDSSRFLNVVTTQRLSDPSQDTPKPKASSKPKIFFSRAETEQPHSSSPRVSGSPRGLDSGTLINGLIPRTSAVRFVETIQPPSPHTGATAKPAMSIKKPAFAVAVTVTSATDDTGPSTDSLQGPIIKLSQPPNSKTSSPQAHRLAKSKSMDVPASSPHEHDDDDLRDHPLLDAHVDIEVGQGMEPEPLVIVKKQDRAVISTLAPPGAFESDV